MREKGIIDICILEILYRYSSPNHKLTQNDIIAYLDNDYNISVNRNTLSGYIAELRHGNYISGERGVYCNRKLKKMADPYIHTGIGNTYYAGSINHTDNTNVCRLVEVINEAIDKRKQIEITGCNYDINGNLVEKGKRIVSPYYIVVEKSRYYLICYSGRQDVEKN